MLTLFLVEIMGTFRSKCPRTGGRHYIELLYDVLERHSLLASLRFIAVHSILYPRTGQLYTKQSQVFLKHLLGKKVSVF